MYGRVSYVLRSRLGYVDGSGWGDASSLSVGFHVSYGGRLFARNPTCLHGQGVIHSEWFGFSGSYLVERGS